MSDSKSIIYTELLSYSKTIESVTQKHLESVKKEQAEVAEKMKKLIEEFQIVSEQMPKKDISEGVERLAKICERLESCRNRVRDVNRRAKIMSLALDYKPPVRTGNLIDVPPVTADKN